MKPAATAGNQGQRRDGAIVRARPMNAWRPAVLRRLFERPVSMSPVLRRAMKTTV